MKRWYFGAALELVVIFSRHGIRSPIQSNAALAPYAASAWPAWSVAPGMLTPHGARQMTAMGAYYRAKYVRDGLLSGHGDADAAGVTIMADSNERTIESAVRMSAGLLPDQPAKIDHLPVDALDPLYGPVRMDLGHPDTNLARAAILGRMGNNPAAIVQANRAAYLRLQQVLFAGRPVAPGKLPPLTEAAGLGPREGSNLVTLTGPLRQGLMLTDALLLEYVEGMPMAQVGWGRLQRPDLTELLSVHSLYFDLTQKTLYCAQAQGSNLARHLRETFDQAARGAPVPGALGTPAQKLLVMVGHDTNIINLAGLLDLSWTVPGGRNEPVLPGGALVFELRKTEEGVQRIRIYYVTQTLDDMRNGDPVFEVHPPTVAPIFIPGCSAATPGYDAPLDAFDARLESAIDPQFVKN